MGLLPNVILNECEGSRPLENIENIEILRFAQDDKNGKWPFGNSPIIPFWILSLSEKEKPAGLAREVFAS